MRRRRRTRSRARSSADVVHLDAALAAAPAAPAARRAARSSGRRAAARCAPIAEAISRVAGAAAQQRAQVVAAAGEQAQVQLAFGRQARAVAVAAERLGHAARSRRSRRRRRDSASAAAVSPGALASSGSSGECSARCAATTSADGSTSSMRQPLVAPTSMYSMKRSTTPRAAEVARHRHDLVVVGAALDDHVDLDRRRGPRARAASMPASTSADREVDVVHARGTRASSSASRLTVTRCRPASFSACGLARQQRAVGGEREVERLAVGACAARPACATRTSRFLRSSGSPPVSRILRTPCGDEQARQPRDLLEAQQRRVRQELVVACRTLPSACSSCSGSCSGR